MSKSTLFWSGVSIAATVMVFTYLLPLEIAMIIVSVTFLHEMAHFFGALAAGAEPDWPLFIPLGIILIGRTKVKNLNIHYVTKVALIGPIVGALVSILFMAIGYIVSSHMIIVTSFWVLVAQLWDATLGVDGRHAWKYRETKG